MNLIALWLKYLKFGYVMVKLDSKTTYHYLDNNFSLVNDDQVISIWKWNTVEIQWTSPPPLPNRTPPSKPWVSSTCPVHASLFCPHNRRVFLFPFTSTVCVNVNFTTIACFYVIMFIIYWKWQSYLSTVLTFVDLITIKRLWIIDKSAFLILCQKC